MIPLFKTRYSIGKSILDVAEDINRKPEEVDNIVQIAVENNLKRLHFVEDSMLGFIAIDKSCKKFKIQSIFGLRMNFCNDLSNPTKEQIHKNVLFIKSKEGYKSLVKLSTIHGTNIFEGEGVLDYDSFHKCNEGLDLAVPFYDSYLYNNTLAFANCMPDFRNISPYYFVEDNDLPFDFIVRDAVESKVPKDKIMKAKSIYYKNREDVYALQQLKISRNRKHGGGSIEKPELEGFSSAEFSWESYAQC